VYKVFSYDLPFSHNTSVTDRRTDEQTTCRDKEALQHSCSASTTHKNVGPLLCDLDLWLWYCTGF